MLKAKGVPWEPVPGREGIAIKSMIDIPKVGDPPMPVEVGIDKEISRRRAGLTNDDIMTHGLTPGCPGCLAANRGIMRNHNDTCRRRIEGLMAQA